MPTANDLPDVLETTDAERLATGFTLPRDHSGIPTATGFSSIFAGTCCFA